MPRRINVDSGRPLEAKAHYSRALRIDDLVLQSGTTAIDLEGNSLGESVVEQIEVVFDIAKASMGLAEGHFDDIVRVRAYVVGRGNLAPARAALERKFRAQATVITLIPVSRLARPTQLVEIELEAVDGARSGAVAIPREENVGVDLSAVRIGKRVLLSGATTVAGEVQRQTLEILKAIVSMLNTAGASRADVVCLRTFIRDRINVEPCLRQVVEILPDVQPVFSVFEVPPFDHENVHIMVEAEAYCASRASRQGIQHPEYECFAQTLCVDDQIYLSNMAPLADDKSVLAPNDWSEQRDRCVEKLQTALGAVGASLDDVVNRRFFTAEHAAQNQGYGDGPAWFEATRPAALGCRIANHRDDDVLLSLEAHAVRGAGENIEWRKLQ